MTVARRAKLKLITSTAIGLATCFSASLGFAQDGLGRSDPSPSDGLPSSSQTQTETVGAEVSSDAASAAGETVVPEAVQAEANPSAADAQQQAAEAPVHDVTASSADPTSKKLQEIAIDAIHSLDPSRLPQRDQAASQLTAAISRLENYIDLNSPNGQAWSQFLQLERLKLEVAAESPKVATLVELERNMQQNYLGLEFSPYQEVRSGIDDLVRALRYGNAPQRTVEQLQLKLEQLVKNLNEFDDSAATDRSLEVGLIANYLYETNQSPAALEQLRQQYSAPNIRVLAHENLVNRMLVRSVAEPSPVNECILGTRVIGTACLVGVVHADLLPMSNGVSLQLQMNANLTTQSNGYNRGVVLGTTSSSPVFATKQIFVSPTGVSSTPASVATNLQTSINSIDHRLRLVRKIASRKAAEQKPQADVIAEGRMQTRVRNQYDQQVNEQLAQSNVRLAALQNQTRPELARLGLPKPQLSYFSTNTEIHGVATQAAAFQLAARQPSGLAKPESSDLVVEAHQSALVNALDIVLGDRTIRNADLDDYTRQATGKVSEEMKQEAAGEPWSITMATYRPVAVEFDDGQVTIKLRIVRMTRGDQELNDNAIIKAVYRPQYASGVVSLIRQGPVEISFTAAERGFRVITLRSFLKGKFDAFFKEQLDIERLDMAASAPGMPRLEVDTIQLDDGWLQVGLR